MFISRMHVSNFGHSGAMFRDFTFNFTDGDKVREAPAVLFSMENRTGKTTLLSFILSCFAPHKDKWLQSVRQHGNRESSMEHYFSPKGIPGLIVFEWSSESSQPDLLGKNIYKKRIMGQMAAFEGGEIKSRHFFGFAPAGKYDFDFIARPVNEAGELYEKIKLIRKECPGAQGTQNQSEWREMLRAYDLDPEFMEMQLDFNRDEGGMDSLLKKISSDEGLLRWLAKYAIPTERVEQVQNLYANLCRTCFEMPKIQQRLAIIKKFKIRLENFETAGKHFEEAENCFAKAIGELEFHQEQMRKREKYLTESLGSLAAEKLNLEKEAGSLPPKARLVEREKDALDLLVLRRRHVLDMDIAQKALADKDAGEKLLREMKAAKILHKLRQARKEMDEARDRAQSGTGEIEPFRKKAINAASALDSILREQIEEKEKAVAESALKIRNIEEGINANDKASRANVAAQAGLEADIRHILKKIEECGKDKLKFKDLLAECGDNLDDAARLLKKTFWEKERALAFFKSQIMAREEEIHKLETDGKTFSINKAALEAKLKNVEAFFEKLEADKYALLQNSLILAVSEKANPDLDKSLAALLDRAIKEGERKNLRLQLELDNAEKEEAMTREFGIRISPDAHLAIAALREKKVNAIPAALALAELDAKEAEKIFLEDPLRYSGIEIENAEIGNLRIRGLAQSMAINASGKTQGMLLPEDDACWNRKAARESLEKLERKKDGLRSEIRRAAASLSGLRTARILVENWLADWALAKENEAERDTLHAKIGDMTEKLAALEKSLGEARASLEKSLSNKDQTDGEIVKLRARIADLDHLIEMEKRSGRAELPQKEKELAAIKQEGGELQAREEKLKSELERGLEGKNRLAISLREFQSERKQLLERAQKLDLEQDIMDQCPLPQEGSLDPARANWDNCAENYAWRLKGLLNEQRELEKAVQALHNIQNQFAETGIGEETAAAHCRLPNLDEAMEERNRQNQRLGEEHEAAVRLAGESIGRMNAFLEKHVPKPEITAPMEAMENGAIAERLRVLASDAELLKARGAELAKLLADISLKESARQNERAELRGDINKIEGRLLEARRFVSENAIFMPGPEWLGDTARLLDNLENFRLKFEKAGDNLKEECGKIKSQAAAAEFRLHYDAISSQIAECDVERLRGSLPGIFEACEGMIIGDEGLIGNREPLYEMAAKSLCELAKTLYGWLKATKRVKMPDETYEIGGETILLTNRNIPGKELSQDVADALIRGKIDFHKEGEGILSALDLAIEMIRGLFQGGKINFRLLTMESNRSLRHRRLEGFTSSGGQEVLSALLLYALNKQAHSRGRFDAKCHMPLFLDGPFNKSNSADMVDAQMKLMKTFKIQPIFFIANPHSEIMDRFDCQIGLVKDDIKSEANGRETTFLALGAPVIYHDASAVLSRRRDRE